MKRIYVNEEWCLGCHLCEYNCAFANSGLKDMAELKGKKIFPRIHIEGDDKINLEKYATTDSPEYKRMVAEIAKRLGLTTLKFARLEDLIESIGLPKCRVCTHCFDGSSYCHEHDDEDHRQLKFDF